MKKRIALIFGGEGCEREISIRSAKSLSALIDRNIYSVIYVEITSSGDWFLCLSKEHFSTTGTSPIHFEPTFPIRIKGKSGFISRNGIIPVHMAIPCLHGDFGEDGIIQGLLSAAHIKYIGQDVYASCLTNDKSCTKLVSNMLQIPTADWILSVNDSSHDAKLCAEEKIGYPMFIKPTRLGSSYGASPVYSEEEFTPLFEEAFRLGQGRVLIEKLVDKSFEVECAYLGTDVERFCPKGIVECGNGFYDYTSKYSSVAGFNAPHTNSPLSTKCEERIVDYSKRLVDFIGIKQLARIDFFVDKDENIYFNEINVFPGMTQTSLYPRLTEKMGLKKGEFINILLSAE